MALQTVGCSGPYNSRTYGVESAGVTRGYAVKVGVADGNCAAISAAGTRAIGILAESTVNVGDAANVIRQGDANAVCGAVVAFGQYVKTDATGRLVPVTGTAGDGEEVVGRAESSTVNVGDMFVCFVNPFVL